MNVLTFDIEDWFHLLDVPSLENFEEWDDFEKRIHIGLSEILRLLRKYDVKAIFFIIGWVADKYPDIVKLINDEGHIIGSHSYYHRLVYKLTPQEFEQDLCDSLKSIEKITGAPVKAYRAPGFSIGPTENWAFDILAKHGIELDASVFSPLRAHGGYGSSFNQEFEISTAHGIIKELPMSYFDLHFIKLVTHGGGYLRFYPKTILKLLWRKSYNMVYLHPRDFDIDQPRIEGLSFLKRIKAYLGLRSTSSKLEMLLKRYEFNSVEI